MAIELPQAAVEATAEKLWAHIVSELDCEPSPWADMPQDVRDEAMATARVVLTAALPHIEAAVREQVAQEIETVMVCGSCQNAKDDPYSGQYGRCLHGLNAASIARKSTSDGGEG